MFIDKLKILMNKNNITSQTMLAEKTNISISTVKNWFQNKSKASFEQLQKLCKYFNVNISYFADEEKNNFYITKEQEQLIKKYNNAEKDIRNVIDKLLSINDNKNNDVVEYRVVARNAEQKDEIKTITKEQEMEIDKLIEQEKNNST